MKISIIIPVYNIEAYIAESAESVLSQEYEDTEIIFVNDCCTDKSMEVLQQVLEKFPRKKEGVRILHHQQNRGLSAARNTGTQQATGRYVLYLDSDDVLADGAIALFVKTAIANNEPTVVMGAFQTFGEKDPWDGKYQCKAMVLNDPKTIFNAYRNDEINTMAWNKLVKREFLTKNNIAFVEGIYHEDIVWSLCVFNHIDTFVSFSDTTYRYRIRPFSITTDKDEIKQADGNLSYLKAWNRLFHTNVIPRDKKNMEFFNVKKLIELKKISRQKHLDKKIKADYIIQILQLDDAKDTLLKLSKRFWWKTPYYLCLWIKAKKKKNQR